MEINATISNAITGLIDDDYIKAVTNYIRAGHIMRCKFRSALAGLDLTCEDAELEHLLKDIEMAIAKQDYEVNKEIYDDATRKSEELIALAQDPAKMEALCQEELRKLKEDPAQKMDLVNYMREKLHMNNKEIAEALKLLEL